MITKNFRNQKGFTLVELLLFMGIFSILLVVLLQLFGAILSTRTESQATSSVDQDGNFILSRLAYDIHNSSNIIYPSLGASCNWPTTQTCHLELSSSTYQITPGGKLTLTAIGNTDYISGVNTKITDISFSTFGNSDPGSKPSVRINFTLQSKIIRQGGILQTQTFQTTVATR